jgi:predicted AlkP superfamily pyrophosphatase or phosphodiesterase
MQNLLLLNIAGLTSRLIGEFTPNLAAFAKCGQLEPLRSALPAVTCPVQASMLTGLMPAEHGIAGNGWYFRDLAEISFWRQSNQLMHGERLWEVAKRRSPAFTCANMFWWNNVASSHDYGATPHPIYKADGRKLPDCLTKPGNWRDKLTERLGRFPLFHFRGPATSIASSRWIADASKMAFADFNPNLTLTYLPHLNYDLQRYGPDLTHAAVRQSLRDLDDVAGDLIAAAQAGGWRVLVVSEYGVGAVNRPIHLNRHLRSVGLLQVRHEDGGEILDPGACAAFAVADHQLAHVYVANPAQVPEVAAFIAQIAGVASVWHGAQRAELGLDHPRSGEIVALADERSWFSYYYWMDDACAPDFARTVEFQRKPGYDPAELFVDPAIKYPRLAVAGRLAKRKLGMRGVMDVIGLDASIVKGSHGRPPDRAEDGAMIMADCAGVLPDGDLAVTDVKSVALRMMFG